MNNETKVLLAVNIYEGNLSKGIFTLGGRPFDMIGYHTEGCELLPTVLLARLLHKAWTMGNNLKHVDDICLVDWRDENPTAIIYRGEKAKRFINDTAYTLAGEGE